MKASQGNPAMRAVGQHEKWRRGSRGQAVVFMLAASVIDWTHYPIGYANSDGPDTAMRIQHRSVVPA